MGEVSLEMLGGLIQRSLEEQASLRREVGEMRSLLLALADQARRTDRRLAEVKDDIEFMVKAELMGRLGFFETQIEGSLDALTERVAAVEARLTPQ